MENKRTLIDQNNNLFNDICSDLNQFKPLLNNLKTIYESLEIGEFTNLVFKQIILSGTQEISNKFRDNIADNVEKLGVTNTLIKNNIISGSETLLEQFITYVDELKKFKPDVYAGRVHRLHLKSISHNSKGFVLTAEDKEQILETQCRIYLESEAEHKLHEKLTTLIEAYNSVKENWDELGFLYNPNYSSFLQGLDVIKDNFLSFNNGKYEIKPTSIRWAVNQKAEMARMRQEINA